MRRRVPLHKISFVEEVITFHLSPTFSQSEQYLGSYRHFTMCGQLHTLIGIINSLDDLLDSLACIIRYIST